MLDLCLTLAENCHRELTRKIGHYAGRVPLIELRLDCLKDPRLPEIPQDSTTQFLATNRPLRQGGYFKGSEKERLDFLFSAAEQGCRWIDLESDVVTDRDLPVETLVIRSFHSFGGFLPELEKVLEDLRSQGGDVYKIALQVSTAEELKRLLLWMETLPRHIQRVVIGMGALGQPSRLLGRFLGNIWTYVSAAEEDPVAPGQFSLESARKLYRISEWKSVPDLYGIISGDAADHLLSVKIHNRLFSYYNQEALLLPLQLDDLEPWFGYMEATGLPFRGLAVAEPFESRVRAFLTAEPTPDIPIDTLKRESGQWIGKNTHRETPFAESDDSLVIEQAAEQFLLWTGIDPDRSLIKEILDA